jgi:Fe-S-cluster containining protein
MFSGHDAEMVDHDIHSTLQRIYRNLPETVCEECGRCCSFRAGMRYVEYLNVRAFIERTWTMPEREALRATVLKHRRLRMVCAQLPPGTPFRLYKPHCLLYDEHKQRCAVYALRPLDCRLHGLGGECDKVRLAREPEVAAASAVSRQRLYEVTAELARVNVPVTDPPTGKTVGQGQLMPVEFWFALHEAGWDPTMDPNDKPYLARSLDASRGHRSPR